MNHLMQEANSFSKINWACAVTLNPFVGFGKCVFGRQLQTSIFENLLTYQYFSFESVNGEVMLKMGWVVKKYNFSILTALNWSECILMVGLYIWLSVYANNETPASFENSTSAHGEFRENLRLKHRSSLTYFLLFSQITVLKKPNSKSKKRILPSPPPSSFFLSLFELKKNEILKDCFNGGSGGLHPQHPEAKSYALLTELPSSLKLRVCSLAPLK